MFEKEIELLKERDTVLCGIITKAGNCTLKLEENSFQALAEAILYQQLSTKASTTIVNRFLTLYKPKIF